jgi:hypothetical protein
MNRRHLLQLGLRSPTWQLRHTSDILAHNQFRSKLK